jgi:CRISPR-associated protein Cas10/Cmr2 subtype III-B
MQVVSGIAGCVDDQKRWHPAFLRFQLGPVQDFIAAARSTRDLWSGSYLLSWLMAAGLKALTSEVGPDSVVFPNLLDQPLFDLHWKKDLLEKVRLSDSHSLTVWESLKWSEDDLRTPNLPNIFLALVPSSQGGILAGKIEEAIREEWKRIADSVWTLCESEGLKVKKDESKEEIHLRKLKFQEQIDQFLSISWNLTPWPDSLNGAIELASKFHTDMPVSEAAKRVKSIKKMAEEDMPVSHRDGRFYEGGANGPKKELSNIGLGWSVILAFNQWQLDAVRQTRAFEACHEGGWQVGTLQNKDSLTGHGEAVAGGNVWKEIAKTMSDGPWKSLFKHGDWIGGPTLVKRVWHISYLNKWDEALKTDSGSFPMPNTRSIAKHRPDAKDDDEKDVIELGDEEKYFAVLALDGDQIGKWVSGEFTPSFRGQLASYQDGSGNETGALEYFERASDPDDGQGTLKDRYSSFLDSNRALSPSYHLQFSQALGQFALRCARKIVQAYKGRLIYAGGDDVLALLPSDLALQCGESLRRAFKGDEVVDPHGEVIFRSSSHGFLEDFKYVDDMGSPIPILVPGPKAECSAGIAIAHFKAPLQDVVRAAQAAEKRAKRLPSEGGNGREAVAVTLMKRSGEIIHWGAKWNGGLELYRKLAHALKEDLVSNRFPHQLASLLQPYMTQASDLMSLNASKKLEEHFPVDEVIQREFEHCLSRQQGKRFPGNAETRQELIQGLMEDLKSYFNSLDEAGIKTADQRLKGMLGLCQTVAFAHRTSNLEK